MERRAPQLTRAALAGRVYADLHVHGFVDDPPVAACGAGPIMRATGDTFDPVDPRVDVCALCADNLRRYERWLAKGIPDRRRR